MFIITKEFHFEATHSLSHLPADHKDHRRRAPAIGCLHGHSYRFVVECTGPKNKDTGVVIECGEMSRLVQKIIDRLDHQNLDDVIPGPSTAENLAEWIYKELWPSMPELLTSIIVHETASTSVAYR